MYASRKYWVIAWMLVLPALIIRVFTTIYPIIETFRISLYDVKLLRGFTSSLASIILFSCFRIPR